MASGSTPMSLRGRSLRSKLACSRRLGRPPDRRHGREEEDRDDEQARKEPSSGGLAVGQGFDQPCQPGQAEPRRTRTARTAPTASRVSSRATGTTKRKASSAAGARRWLPWPGSRSAGGFGCAGRRQRGRSIFSARTQRRGETPSSSGPLSVSASASSTSSRRREDRRERARGLPACSRRAVLERLRDVVFVSARDGA